VESATPSSGQPIVQSSDLTQSASQSNPIPAMARLAGTAGKIQRSLYGLLIDFVVDIVEGRGSECPEKPS
jgi:hypothetical protein